MGETDDVLPKLSGVSRRDFLKLMGAAAASTTIPPDFEPVAVSEKILADFSKRFDPANMVTYARMVGRPTFVAQVDPRTTINDTIAKDFSIPFAWMTTEKSASLGDALDAIKQNTPLMPRLILPVLTTQPNDLNVATIVKNLDVLGEPDSLMIPAGTGKLAVVSFHTEEDVGNRGHRQNNILRITWVAITNYYNGDRFSDDSRTVRYRMSYSEGQNHSRGGGLDSFTPTGTIFIPTDFDVQSVIHWAPGTEPDTHSL